VSVAARLLALAHLGIAAIWLGSMTYSLMVVQPRVGRFFTDETRREEFLVLLANGNRRPVVALVSVLVVTAGGLAVLTSPAYAVVLALYLAAAAVFWHVSWRHWPARVFARPDELAGFRRQLRTEAWTMLVLVGTAYAVALIVTLWRV